MATSSIKKRINNLKKATITQPDFKSSDIYKNLYQTTSEKLSSQLGNYEKRAAAAGIDLEEKKDKRNPIEKALNLPEGQNALFDIFEIIGRPQQAVFGGIKAAQEGKDVLKAAKKGISGEKETNFGDILRNAGMSDKKLFKNPLNKEDVSASDIVGLIGDITLDPVDIGLLASVPLTGGATAPAAAGKIAGDTAKTAKLAKNVAKGAKALDTAKDLAKAEKVIDTTADVAKGVKALDTAKDLAKGADIIEDTVKAGKTAEKAADGYKWVFRPSLNPFNTTSKSLLDLAAGGAWKGTKKLAGITDKGIEAALKASDNKALRRSAQAVAKESGLDVGRVTRKNVDNVLDLIGSTGEDVNKLGTDKLGFYKDIKKSVGRTIDYAKSIPDNLLNRTKRTDNELDMIKDYANTINDNFKKRIGDYLSNQGIEATDDAINSLADDIQRLRLSKYEPEDNAYNFLSNALRKGSNTFSGTKEEVENLYKSLNDFKGANNITEEMLNPKIRYTKDGAELTVKTTGKKSSKYLSDVVKNNSYKDNLSNIRFKKGQEITDETIKDLSNKYDTEDLFKELVDTTESDYKAINDLVEQATNGEVSYNDMLRDWYTKRAINPEVKQTINQLKQNNIGLGRYSDETVKGNKKLFSERKTASDIDTANAQFGEQVSKSIAIRDKRIDSLNKRIYAEDVKETKNAIEGIKNEIKNTESNFRKNLDNLNINQVKKDELVKLYNKNIDNIGDIIDDETIKKIGTLYNDLSFDQLIKKTEKYNKSSLEINRLKKELSRSDLTKKEASSLANKLYKEYDKLNKYQLNLVDEVGKVQDNITGKYTKDIGTIAKKVADNTSDYTRKAIQASEKSDSITSKIRNLDEAYNKQVKGLADTQARLEGHLSKLENMTADEIKASDKYYLDKIESIQREKDLLSSLEGKELFNKSYFEGIGDFTNNTIKEAKTMNLYNEALLKSGLNNEDVLKFIPKGENAGKIPPGYVRLKGEDAKRITSYLTDMQNFLPNSKELINEFKNRVANSNAIVIDKGVSDLLKLKVNEKDVNPLLKVLDKYNNLFKKAKTITPGTQLRNITGNMTNMYLSGVPLHDIVRYYGKADKITKSSYILDLMDKSVKGTLTKKELKDFNIIKKYVQGGFLGQGKEVQDIGKLFEEATHNNASKGMFKKAWDKLFEVSAKANEFVDNRNRMALLAYAENNPKYIRKLGAKDGIDAVRHVLFDPSNMSPFEMNFVKKAIPFYTFAKQNLVFQANNLIKNTSRYNRLFKTFNETYDTVGEGNYNQYQKENMEIPLFKTKNDNLVSVKSNLPVADLMDTIDDPLQKLVNVESPLIKTPIETVTGVDTFTGRELNRTTPETITSLLGVDTLTTSQAKKIKNLYEDIGNDEEKSKIVTDILPSVLRYADNEKIQNSKMYEDLQTYQDVFRELKNEGMDIPTIRDLSTKSSISLKNLKAKRRKLNRSR